MDTQLQELIDAIKAEGVQTAEKQAEQIIAAAEEKAKNITSEAEAKKRALIEEAESARTKLEQSGRATLVQAGRDLILSVQAKLTEMFRSVVAEATGEAISADILENTITSLVAAWSQGREEPLHVLLNQQDLDRLETRLRNRLADHLASGAEIRPSDTIKSGFRVSSSDGSLYYDFTVETIAEALSAYVGPRLSGVLKDAAESAASQGSSGQ